MFDATPRELAQTRFPAASSIPTLADAALTPLPAPVVQVEVLSYATGKAFAPATYKQVSAQPSRPVGYETAGWFQSRDGRYFEVQPDQNGRMQVVWFGDDIAGTRLAQAVSKRIWGTPGFFYELPTTGGTVITGFDEDADIDFSQSTIAMVQGCVAFISIAGTYSDTLDVTSIAGNVLTVPGGVGSLVKGDVVKMADTMTPHWWSMAVTRNGTYGTRRAGEHGIVKAASGTTLTMTATPKWATDRTPEYMREMLRTDVVSVTDNGSGGIRVGFGHRHFGTTGINFTFENIGGVTAANGTFPVTVIDTLTVDIVGPTFSGTYTPATGTGRKSLTYSTHATAAFKVGKLRDNTCRIRVGKWACAASVTSTAARIIKVSVRKDLDWHFPHVQKSTNVLLSPVSCFGGTIRYYGASTGVGNTGYIMTVAGCDNLVVEIDGSGTTRHAIDGGAASTADGVTGLAASGAAARCSVYVKGGNIGSTEVAHATHAGTDSWTFYYPKASQSASNVVVRGIGHTVVGARSLGTGNAGDPDDPEDLGPDGGGSFASFCQFTIGVVSAAASPVGTKIRLAVDGKAGRGPDLATGMRVRVGGATGASATSTNGYWYITVIGQGTIGSTTVTYVDLDGTTFSSATGAGDAMMDAGFDGADTFTVVEATMDDNPTTMFNGRNGGGSATFLGGMWRGTGNPSRPIYLGRSLKVRNLNMEFGGVPEDGIFWAGAFTELLDIDGIRIDAAGALPALFDMSTRVQDGRFLLRKARIYNPSGALASLYRNVSLNASAPLPPSGSRIGDVWIYGACTTLVTGLSMAASIAALAPFIDGPIWVNNTLIAGPGYRITSWSLGTMTTGTLTLDPGLDPMQHYTNNGAHTLAPGAIGGIFSLDITNGASAGAITTSGWTKVSGDSFTTTNGHKFRCRCTVGNAGSLLDVRAMQ